MIAGPYLDFADFMPRNSALPLGLSQRAVGISTPSGSGRDIDTFPALHRSLRTAAMASLKDGVAEGSFALGTATRPISGEGLDTPGEPGGEGWRRFWRRPPDGLQLFDFELRPYRSNGSV
jgi:hypothetical protein